MFPDKSQLVRLYPGKNILPFDCGDNDLNEFLHNDSLHYLNELLAVTYLLETDEETIAFYSVSNDKISHLDLETNNKWNKFRAIFPREKRMRSYPAVKIGRLGVSNNFKGQGIGTAILDYIKLLFVNNNRTGCRYITVDAYAQSLKFYENNGFKYLTTKDEGKDTRLMYYPLNRLTNSVQHDI